MAPLMRAARLHEPGQPLRIDTVERPVPRPDDVMVQVKSCGVIPNMNAIFSGKLWNHLPTLPASVGLDAAGVIAAIGEHVVNVRVGGRVYVNPWLPRHRPHVAGRARTHLPHQCTIAEVDINLIVIYPAGPRRSGARCAVRAWTLKGSLGAARWISA